jgi:hypothetical protein
MHDNGAGIRSQTDDWSERMTGTSGSMPFTET